ncbi:MAG TPA: IS91 family transposase [Bryobacteraceae bacterium]|nr:IS91 family transposase [Bryobacteraceae bacterium]
MARPVFELADIFRQYGDRHRAARRLPLQQLRVMRAIEVCRTSALGGHAEKCGQCDYTRISYNSCRNRHCPKCQNGARAKWLESRQGELLPVEYFHVVFTVPEPVARLAFYNKEAIYGILFRAASEALLTIARDPRHLGAEIGFFGILHTWGQNLLHHPHIHFVIPGGGIGPDLEWVSCRPGFFLPVRVLSRLFRRLLLAALSEAFEKQQLQFPGETEALKEKTAFRSHLAWLEECEWVVYAKPPFGGPQKVLDYLGRYTHRVALSNDRILDVSNGGVTFQWRDYRSKDRYRSRTMTVPADEFIRRFLIHTLPPGFQRIRYFGFLANRFRKEKLELCGKLLSNPVTALLPSPAQRRELAASLDRQPPGSCPKCGTGLLIRVTLPVYRWPAKPPDTS